MDFKTLFEKISPRLKRIAKRHSYYSQFLDESDLYQQMCLYLWNRYKNEIPEDFNDSYIIKGCEFFILNYLRKTNRKERNISLDEPIGNTENTLKDTLTANIDDLNETLDKKMVIEYVANNGFSEKEKNVFTLLLEGHTVREIGCILGFSHVMALKYKKRLLKKCRKIFS